mgnify:FL=1
MITVQEAHGIVASALPAAQAVETVMLEAIAGRVLAEEVRAGFPMPRFTNAAMDGFAVRFDDIRAAVPEQPARLPVAMELPAGATQVPGLPAGSCARIMTGAPLPEGADTVVAFEETSGFGSGTVEFYKPPKRGANIRHAGEEVDAGEVLVTKGTRATPAVTAILATFGFASARVCRRPRVTVLTVGDELRMPGEAAGPLAIYNSNLPMLEACVRAVGAEVSEALQLPDDPERIGQAIRKALDDSNILVTAGGISTGQYDFVQAELTGLGVTQRFWKVAQKPGKPLYFGTAPSGSLVFSLPGNPVSALVCFLEYCTPALYRMQGVEPPAKIGALLETPFPTDRKRHRFLFGRLRVAEGRLLCSVSSKIESHMLTASGGANCIVEAPASEEPLAPGTLVTCNLLPWAGAF